MLEPMKRPEDVKVATKKKKGTGIKALITVGDLSSVVHAAKKWQAHVVEEGGDGSKLLHHIANAEAVLVKYTRRNQLAYERRKKRRDEEQAEAAVEAMPENQAGAESAHGEMPAPSGFVGNLLGRALEKALGKKPQATDNGDAKRPTKW